MSHCTLLFSHQNRWTFSKLTLLDSKNQNLVESLKPGYPRIFIRLEPFFICKRNLYKIAKNTNQEADGASVILSSLFDSLSAVLLLTS